MKKLEGALFLLFSLIFLNLFGCQNSVSFKANLNPNQDAPPNDESPQDNDKNTLKGPDVQSLKADQIYRSMISLTNLNEASLNRLKTKYDSVAQSLPIEGSLESLSSQKMILISHFAYDFCEELVDNSTNQMNFFSNTNYSHLSSANTPSQLWATEASRQELAEYFIQKMWSGDSDDSATQEGVSLIEDLSANNSDNMNSSLLILRSLCSTTLASALMFQ